MKNLIGVFLISAVMTPVMAATITFGTPVTTVPGQVTIPWMADAPVVGISLKVNVTDGTVTNVQVLPASFFDVFVDSAFTAGSGYIYKTGIPTALQTGPGQLALPQTAFSISAAGLDDDGIGTGTEIAPTSGLIVMQTQGIGCMTTISIDADTLRGGIVGYAGAMTANALPLNIQFSSGLCETITTPTLNKTTAAPAIAARVNGGRVETFVASASSNLGHTLQYNFSWGDSTSSGWQDNAALTHTYSYAASGTYTVTVQARCKVDTATVSAVSSALILTTEEVKSTAPFYAAWAQYGRPTCWAYPRNCKGDIDGAKQGSALAGYAWVSTNDLTIFLAAYNVKEPTKGVGILNIPGHPNAICADFLRNQQGSPIAGYSRVSTNDLNPILTNFNIKEPPKGPGIGVCAQTNYHYWTGAL